MRKNQTKLKLVYILGASHSGTTLLALLLGSHREICTVGELKLTSLGDPDNYLCSCRARIKDCKFWQEVKNRMAQKGVMFDIHKAGTDFRSVDSRYAGFLLRPLCRPPFLESLRDMALMISPRWRQMEKEISERNALLIETLLEITGKKIVVDSSKIGLRLKYLLKNPKLEVKVIWMVRDGRAVSLTYMDPLNFADAKDPRLRKGGLERDLVNRYLTMGEAAKEWKRSNEEAMNVLKFLPPSHWMRVHYEELCTDTKNVLSKIALFLGVSPEEFREDFRNVDHHVVGNGMRLDQTNEIILDERWKGVLSIEDLKTFDQIAGDLNREFGYY